MRAGKPGPYWQAAAHPFSALLFSVPLLMLYEIGVVKVAAGGVVVRAGADEWARQALINAGVPWPFAAPTILLATLAAWAYYRRADRPKPRLQTFAGMVLESVLLAALLWALAKNVGPILERWRPTHLAVEFRPAAARELLVYLGAGLYEEAIFRLGIYVILVLVLRRGGLPALVAAGVAAPAGAALFALAHHAGPAGEALRSGVFLFRALAGLYFTAVFVLRGFGVAAGAHAAYDVLVGVEVG